MTEDKLRDVEAGRAEQLFQEAWRRRKENAGGIPGGAAVKNQHSPAPGFNLWPGEVPRAVQCGKERRPKTMTYH